MGTVYTSVHILRAAQQSVLCFLSCFKCAWNRIPLLFQAKYMLAHESYVMGNFKAGHSLIIIF